MTNKQDHPFYSNVDGEWFYHIRTRRYGPFSSREHAVEAYQEAVQLGQLEQPGPMISILQNGGY